MSLSREKTNNTETREHLANERTLLAWVRTGVALISVGFVVERAGALASSVGQGADDAATEVFGLALVALGCLTLVVGARQFFVSRRMISAGNFESRPLPYVVVVAGSLALAAAFVLYVLIG
nr:DUF202 domain-containing protein [Rubrobacter indicoceani]